MSNYKMPSFTSPTVEQTLKQNVIQQKQNNQDNADFNKLVGGGEVPQIASMGPQGTSTLKNILELHEQSVVNNEHNKTGGKRKRRKSKKKSRKSKKKSRKSKKKSRKSKKKSRKSRKKRKSRKSRSRRK